MQKDWNITSTESVFPVKEFTHARFNVTAVFLKVLSSLLGYDVMSMGV